MNSSCCVAACCLTKNVRWSETHARDCRGSSGDAKRQAPTNCLTSKHRVETDDLWEGESEEPEESKDLGFLMTHLDRTI